MENPTRNRGDATTRRRTIKPETKETVTVNVSGVKLELAINFAIATLEALRNEYAHLHNMHEEGPFKAALEDGFTQMVCQAQDGLQAILEA